MTFLLKTYDDFETGLNLLVNYISFVSTMIALALVVTVDLKTLCQTLRYRASLL